MLQQTQVQTVIPYWQRWLEAFPDVTRLAQAQLDHVLKLWEGLGYYTRARNVHRAARIVAEEHGAVFPRTQSDLLNLPGIGRYTAGAICSIAFDQATAILDGNITRVLARLFGIQGNVRLRQINDQLWDMSQQLVQSAATLPGTGPRPCSTLNQALMELGAIVCKPKQPACSDCPLHSACVARRLNLIETLPHRETRPATTQRHFAAFVAECDGCLLVRKRPPTGVNAHLWEFPNVEVNGSASNPRRVARLCLGSAPRTLEPFCVIRHSITRYRIKLEVYRVNLAGKKSASTSVGEWSNLEQLKGRAFSSAHKQILEQYLKSSGSSGSWARRKSKSERERLNDGNCSHGRKTRSRPPQAPGQARKSSSRNA
jgi:A/G-specific adenine glycosylase